MDVAKRKNVEYKFNQIIQWQDIQVQFANYVGEKEKNFVRDYLGPQMAQADLEKNLDIFVCDHDGDGTTCPWECHICSDLYTNTYTYIIYTYNIYIYIYVYICFNTTEPFFPPQISLFLPILYLFFC